MYMRGSSPSREVGPRTRVCAARLIAVCAERACVRAVRCRMADFGHSARGVAAVTPSHSIDALGAPAVRHRNGHRTIHRAQMPAAGFMPPRPRCPSRDGQPRDPAAVADRVFTDADAQHASSNPALYGLAAATGAARWRQAHSTPAERCAVHRSETPVWVLR